MEKRKGVDLLLKGYRRYRELGGTKELILAGKMQEDDIDSLLKQTMAQTKGITYLDYVTHDKNISCLQTAPALYFRLRRRALACR